MPHIFANGAKISYQQFGEGPDVILIHGLAANRAFWYLHALQALKENYRVTIYDLRGHGYSSMPDSGYTSSDMANDLSALMDHLQIPSAVIIGHSFGGVIGLQYATRHNERVKGLVLADSRIQSLQPAQRLDDHPDQPGLEHDVIETSDGDWKDEAHVGMRLLEEFARNKLKQGKVIGKPGFTPFASKGKSDRSARLWIKLLDTTTARNDIRSSAGLTIERIDALNKPVVSIYGERSRCMETCQKLRLRLPHSDTIIIPEVGHFHPITRPRYFNNAVLDFLEMATTSQGELLLKDGKPDASTTGRRTSERRNGSREENSCRRVGERRIAWRKRGWDGPDRRNGPRSRR